MITVLVPSPFGITILPPGAELLPPLIAGGADLPPAPGAGVLERYCLMS